jgi:hypothetical protein
MKILMALVVVMSACNGPKPKPESPIVNEGSQKTAETCCCKSFPLTNESGTPSYELGGRMDCSSKQGTCVNDVQCQKK